MVCLVCSVRDWSTGLFPSPIPEKKSVTQRVPWSSLSVLERSWKTEGILFISCLYFFKSFRDRAILRYLSCVRVLYISFHLLWRKEDSATSSLTSLMFPILTYCLIFKLSWKSQQSLVGETSWGNFKCTYNFYLPSLPAIKWWPLQVGLIIFQRSKLLLPGMIETQKLAMSVMPVWPSLRNIALVEKMKRMHTCVETPLIVQHRG